MGATKTKTTTIDLDTENQELTPKKEKKAKVRGKKYLANKAKVDRNKLYDLSAAIELAKTTSYSKFDGTIELHLVVKKEGVSVSVVLPHATGKAKKIEVATDATIEKLKLGKVDFDVLLSTPEMMQKLVIFAKILGPKGMMPNPKNGTLIKTEADAKKYAADALVSLPSDAKVSPALAKQIQEWAVSYILAWGMERLPEDLDKEKYGKLPGVDETEKSDQKDEMVSNAVNAWIKKDYKPMASLINEVKSNYEKGTVEERVWDLAAKSLELKNTTDNKS